MGGGTEVKGIQGIIEPQGIGITPLDLEDNTVKIHNINFKNVYYLPWAPKLLAVPHKLDRYRGGV